MVIQAAAKPMISLASSDRPELELAGIQRMIDDGAHAAHFAADLVADEQHADDNDDHLDEVGDRHRPHTAEEGVDQDGAGADPHPRDLADVATGHHVEHQT